MKIPVRAVAQPLVAFQAIEEQFVEMNGRDIRVFPLDWIICRPTGVVVDVHSPKQFSRFYEPIVEGQMTITPEQRTSLTKALGVGTTDTAETLISAVRRVAALKIGDIPVNFTPQQWEELARRADKRNVPVKVYVAQVVDRLLQDLWTSA